MHARTSQDRAIVRLLTASSDAFLLHRTRELGLIKSNFTDNAERACYASVSSQRGDNN
jgi:hypothetical protein